MFSHDAILVQKARPDIVVPASRVESLGEGSAYKKKKPDQLMRLTRMRAFYHSSTSRIDKEENWVATIQYPCSAAT